MNYKTLSNFENLQGQLVLVRVDFNVPMNNGKILDNARIQAHLPTIKNLTDKGARVVIISHLGRPTNNEPELSLLPIANELEKLLDQSVSFCSGIDKQFIDQAKAALKPGKVLILENIRFFDGETDNDTFLASMLSNDVSLYVNDAFASSHRSHTSVDAICKFVKQKAVGMLMEEELRNLNIIDKFKQEQKKIAIISSGAKISTKLGLLRNLLDYADDVFIAGAMANTFIASQGYEVGTSKHEEDMLKEAKAIIEQAADNNCQIHLPTDVVCSYEPKSDLEPTAVSIDNIPASMMALDTGSETVANWIEKLKEHDLILINGPLGVFEVSPFDNGTNELFKQLNELGGYKVAGGGDTLYAIHKSGTEASFDFISTGGGALLEALEGKMLPGIKAITE
ncbi:MAG TPA: phosphoglycerate kinase [Alphaproteobacteria bacterium]|nr:phosphoglycerate kinase [Alphaproteobacteria bacterium]